MYDIVIAKYSENISWIYDLVKLNSDLIGCVYIYDKSDAADAADACEGIKFKKIKLKNIGREAETYLHHISTNYDTLSEYTVFFQGNPFDHVLKDNINVRLNKFVKSFEALLPHKAVNEKYFVDPNRAYYKLPVFQKIKQFFEYKNDNENEISVSFAAGAQFVVSRNCIHTRPQAFYELLKKQMHSLIVTNLCSINNLYQGIGGINPIDLTIDAWTMERIWSIIFDADNYILRQDLAVLDTYGN